MGPFKNGLKTTFVLMFSPFFLIKAITTPLWVPLLHYTFTYYNLLEELVKL